MQKKHSIVGWTLFLIYILSLTLLIQPVKSSGGTTVFYDDFDGTSLSSGWNVENLGGNYSLNNGILTLSSDIGKDTGLAVYMDFIPQTDNFTVSCRVKSHILDFVALRIQFKSLPICLSATAATLQMRPDQFLAVIAYTVYPIYSPTTTGDWYVLEMKVQKNPFTITFNVYDDVGALLGTTTVTITGFGYLDIRYICLQIWNTGLNPIYDIDWLKIETPESPAVEWYKTYGGAGLDSAWRVVQTKDGGYAFTGYTQSFGAGGWDLWLVKTDSSGIMKWNKTFGGSQDDGARWIIQTIDGGYALAGDSWSFAPDRTHAKMWLVKTDTNGNEQWNKTYSGRGWEGVCTIIQTSDGGYTLIGFTAYGELGPDLDFWLVRTDSSGNQIWAKTYGTTKNEWCYSGIQTKDGGYALAGATNSYGASDGDFWLVKTDANGNQQWNRTYGGAAYDGAYSVVQTSDGGYAISGYTESFGAGCYLLVRTDSNGHQIWAKTYGRTISYHPSSMIQTIDGGFAISGYTTLGAGDLDAWMVKTDASGNQEWNFTFGGSGRDLARCVIQTNDGGYALAGDTASYGAGSSDFLLIKLAPTSPRPNPPVANFSWSPSIPIKGQPVTFNASSSLPGWNGTHTMPIVLYSWNFGDGNTGTGQIVNHTYTRSGNYTVTLNVTDSEGLWNLKQKQILVDFYVVIDQAIVSGNRWNGQAIVRDVDSFQTIEWHAKWPNGSNVIGGSIYIAALRTHTEWIRECVTNNTGWAFLNVSSNTVGLEDYVVYGVNCSGISGNKYRLWGLGDRQPYIIWNRVKIVQGGVTNSTSSLGKTETIWFKAIYEYDNGVFNGAKGILYVNDSAMQWSNVNSRWEYSYTGTSLGLIAFKVTRFSDNEYNLTAMNDQAGIQTITFWGSPSLTISLDSATSYTGFKVNLSGKLSYNGTGIPQSDLLLSYSVTKGQTWNEITSVTTASDGGYSAQWIPSATGNYLVRVKWDGNETFYLKGGEAYTTLAVTQSEEKYVFSVVSNSTVSELAFNSTSRVLSFTVSGPSGTTGYTNITIAKSLIGDISGLKIYLDGNQISYNAISIGDSWLLHFTYQHSVHKVVVSLGPPPSKPFIETPLGIATISGVTIVLIVVILIALKRKVKLIH